MLRVALLTLLLSAPTLGVTLEITPNKLVYSVGEEIVLDVVGDSMDHPKSHTFATLLYDASLAEFVSSSQVQMTSFGGALPWTVGFLDSGPGFARVLSQIGAVSPHFIADDLFYAQVTLRATAPGALGFDWDRSTLDFFFVSEENSPGGSVTIVPEPGTAALLIVGLLAFSPCATRSSGTR